MVSQRSMHRMLALRSCLLGLAGFLLGAPGCGQDEGGRCQVNSDCANGLVCREASTTGNGICGLPGTGSTDAARDIAADSSSAVGAETEGPAVDVATERGDTAAAVDLQPVPRDAEADAPLADAGPPVVDGKGPALEAGPAIDVAPAVDVQAMDTLAID